MRVTVVAVLCALALVGCSDPVKEAADWQAFCVSRDFSSRQCEVLWALRHDIAKDKEENAEASGVAVGAASGLAIGQSMGHR